MKRWLILLPIFAIAAEVTDIGVVTQNEGIEFHHCHEGDKAMIEVVHVSRKETTVHGFFETDKLALYLSDLSMIPTGTNIFRVRTVCSGSTSEVSEVSFIIRRRIPRPLFAKAERFPQMPPMVPGMLMALPGGTNGTNATNQVLEPARFQGTNVIRRRSQ